MFVSRVLLRSLLVVCALALFACSDDDQPTSDTSFSPDAGAMDSTADVTAADSSVDQGLACRNALDLSPLTLSADYCVLARVTVPNSGAFALSLEASPTFFGYEAAAGAREMVVRAYPIDLVENRLGAGNDRFDFTVAGEDDFYAGLFLARHGEKLSVGYTLSDFSGDVVTGSPAADPLLTVAPGNFDAVYLDDGRLVVNGLGLGSEQGQGVYVLQGDGSVAQLIGAMGDGSGFLARGASVLYAGYYDFTAGANKLYAFTLQEMNAALDSATPLTVADGDLAYEGDLADITAVADTLVVLDASFTEFHAVRTIAASVSDDAVVMEGPVAIVTAEVVSDPSTPTELSSSDGVIGLRLGSGDSAELALIRAR